MAENMMDSQDFGVFLDDAMAAMRQGFEVGEQISGVVSSIDKKSVYVDVGGRSEGIVDRLELTDADGQLRVKVGDTLTAYVVGGGGEDDIRLGMSHGAKGDKAGLWDAYQGGIPVDGRVESERTGGFEVTVAGKKAFCPYSQIDIFRQDAQAYIGEKFRFKIVEYDEWGDNMVVSRRQLLEEERERQQAELKESLAVGDVVDGRVTKLMDFGVFVDLGGVEGLIPMSQLAWSRVESAAEVVSVGDRVKVSIQAIDWEKRRISLSLKAAQGNPWDEVASKYAVGRRVEGRVTKLMPFGAFVQLEAGIEGLVHISKLGAGRRIGHPSEVLKEGELVEVEIEAIDGEQKRMSLSLDHRRPQVAAAEAAAAVEDDRPQPVGEVVPGGRISGVVQGIKDFGLFVSLPGGRTGLLHVSQIDYKGGRDKAGWFRVNFPEGSPIEVVVKEITGERVSLTTQERWDAEHAREDYRDFMAGSGGGSLGSVGDALAKLKL